MSPRRTRESAAGARRWRRAAFGLAAAAVIALAASVMLGIRSVRLDRAASLMDQRLEAKVAMVTADRNRLATGIEELNKRTDSLAAELAKLTSPRLNIPVLELLPRALVTRGGGSPEIAAVPVGASVVTLLLTAHDLRPVAERALDVVDDTGATVWSGSGLRLSELHDYTVQLPVGGLPSGDLQLIVRGREGTQWTELDRYRLRMPASPIND